MRQASQVQKTIPFSIGIAVQPENFERIRAANGSPRLAEVPPDQDAMEFELRSGEHEEFDILTTRDPGGPGAIARYLQKFGEGIQQIEVNVASVNRATQVLRNSVRPYTGVSGDARGCQRHARKFFSRAGSRRQARLDRIGGTRPESINGGRWIIRRSAR